MNSATKRFILLAGTILSFPALHAQNTNVFELRDGDRVAFIGDTLIEREAVHGYIEYAMTVRFPDRHVTFRNLGWSADLPNGISRVSFDWSKPPEAWFQNLLAQIETVRPTVAVLGYGMAASFAGEPGLAGFTNGMQRLIDGIKNISPEARFIVMSPIRHEMLPAPLPNPAGHNRDLEKYSAALRELATINRAHFVPLFDRLTNENWPDSPPPLTDNGIHLTGYGYRRAAEVVAQSLGWEPNTWRVGITSTGNMRQGTVGSQIIQLEQRTDYLRLVTLDEFVLPPRFDLEPGEARPPVATPPPWLQIRGLDDVEFEYKIDGELVRRVPGAAFNTPVMEVVEGPHYDQAGALMEAIRRKNELFFHRWRPQNSTYLFLFRKHEQGQNAAEIPMFDPLIEEQENRIAELRKPVPRVFEITKAPEEVPELESAEADPPAPERPLFVADETWPRPEFLADENLEITLWAENPLLTKPIQMNFDPQGRLWVASSSVYPQIKPGQEADDKILVLRDTDGDGAADETRVFAEGLLIPTGVEPGDGGVYVGHSTELLHFKDTDGDGRADERRIVLSGFGTEDTHHILHTLRWGYDGRLYMNQSIYIHTHMETPHGVVRLNSGGILHLNPGSMKAGILMKGLVNSWGHHFDYFGQSFATDGAGTPQAGLAGITYVVPGAMYHTYAGARRILGSISPGSYPKFCGLEFLHSPHFPDDWQGDLVTCDFRANRVVRFDLEEKGSAYTATEQPLLLRTGDVTFRPIDVKIGPDGALYIADWSNPIIQHGEVDFRDPRRDHIHGRIWRVAYKGRALSPSPVAVTKASVKELLDLLLSHQGDTRKQARRVLVERGSEVLPELERWLAGHTEERARLEGLWMHQSLHATAPELLLELLEAEDGRVRAAAVRVLQSWHDEIPQTMELLAQRVADDHPRVRLEALRALAEIPTEQSAALALSVLEKPMDEHLDYGLWLTINDLAEPWIRSIQSGEWPVEGHEEQLAFGLNAIEPGQASLVMDQILSDRTLPRDGSGPWIGLIGKAGGPDELQKLFDQVLGNGFDADASSRALAALREASRVRGVKPAAKLERLGAFFDHDDAAVRTESIRLAGAWKNDGGRFDRLVDLAGGASTSDVLREAAFDTLRELGGRRVLDALQPLVAGEASPAVRRDALAVLAALNIEQAAPLAVRVLSEIKEENVALELWRDLLRVRGAADALTKALPATGLSPVLAKSGLRAAREGGRNEPVLILALSRGADLDDEVRELTAEEMNHLAESVNRDGNPGRGEQIYRRMELACVTCHAIGGVGGKVGPDLTSIGASAPVDYLIESLLYPNRKIKEGYHSVVIETRDDEEISGILFRETGEQVFVRDVLNREVAVAKNNIARRTAGNSLMPAGLIDALSHAERLDLLRFLAVLGKPGPYDATQGNVARLWRLSPGTIDLAQFGDDKVLQSDTTGNDWMSGFSLVDGRLPRSVLKEAIAMKSWRNPQSVYALAKFELPSAGPVTFQAMLPKGATVWLDKEAQSPDAGGTFRAQLPAGLHQVMVKLEAGELPEHIRLEIDRGTFLVE